jgi:hypothetical protein
MYVLPSVPQTGGSFAPGVGHFGQDLIGEEAVGTVVIKGAPLRFEVGVGMVMSCAKTFDWLEPAILNSTIPKIGTIFVMEN